MPELARPLKCGSIMADSVMRASTYPSFGEVAESASIAFHPTVEIVGFPALRTVILEAEPYLVGEVVVIAPQMGRPQGGQSMTMLISLLLSMRCMVPPPWDTPVTRAPLSRWYRHWLVSWISMAPSGVFPVGSLPLNVSTSRSVMVATPGVACRA